MQSTNRIAVQGRAQKGQKTDQRKTRQAHKKQKPQGSATESNHGWKLFGLKTFICQIAAAEAKIRKVRNQAVKLQVAGKIFDGKLKEKRLLEILLILKGITILFTAHRWWRHNSTYCFPLFMKAVLYTALYWVTAVSHSVQLLNEKEKNETCKQSMLRHKIWQLRLLELPSKHVENKTHDRKEEITKTLHTPKKSSSTKINDLAVPAITGLNTPQIADFRYCTQFYTIDGQSLTTASAKVGIHTTWSLKLKSESWKDAELDDFCNENPSLRWPEQPRCWIPAKENRLVRFKNLGLISWSHEREIHTQGKLGKLVELVKNKEMTAKQ